MRDFRWEGEILSEGEFAGKESVLTIFFRRRGGFDHELLKKIKMNGKSPPIPFFDEMGDWAALRLARYRELKERGLDIGRADACAIICR